MEDWRSQPRKRYNLMHLREGESHFFGGIDWQEQKRIEWATRICTQRTGRMFQLAMTEHDGEHGLLVTYTGERPKPIDPITGAQLPKRSPGRPALYNWESLPFDRETRIPCDNTRKAEALLRSLYAWLAHNTERVHGRIDRGPVPAVVVFRSSLPRQGVRPSQ